MDRDARNHNTTRRTLLTADPVGAVPPPPAPRSRRAGKRAQRLAGLVVVVVSLLAAGLWYIGVFGGNVHAVVPGQVYRSAELTGATLGAVLRSDHIRTVVNLRGGSARDAWYRSEAQECRSLGVRHLDVALSATHLPPPQQLRTLLADFDNAAYPVLFHCNGGADRSGLVGTLYLVIYRNVPLDQAEREELTFRYGHVSFGATAAMNRFFDLYRRSNGNRTLRDWILNTYPAVYAQSLATGS